MIGFEHAVAAHQSRQWDGHVLHPGDLGRGRANGHDRPPVAQDIARDPRQGAAHAIIGGPLALNNLIGGAAHSLVDGRALLAGQFVAAQGHKIAQRHVADVGQRPHQHLGVAVLAHDVGVDVGRIDADGLTQ